MKNYFKILFKANNDYLYSRLGVSDLRNNNPKKKKSINLYLKKFSISIENFKQCIVYIDL